MMSQFVKQIYTKFKRRLVIFHVPALYFTELKTLVSDNIKEF